jgi:hypothetical protein
MIGLFAFGQKMNSNENLVRIDGYIFANVKINTDVKLSNRIYKQENVLIFSYRFIDKNGKEFLFYKNKNGTWDYFNLSQGSTNVEVMKRFKLKILKNEICYQDPKYCQQAISYSYDNNNINVETTGLIENEKNIWLHPPRFELFSILELNPFPYIKYPLQIGNSWEWKLKIGGAWGDKRWKEWTGIIENHYKYRIVDYKPIKTSVGTLNCFIIESKAESPLGETKLKSYFNQQYGFVKLEYTNIDNSKLEINFEGLEVTIIDFFKASQ